MLSDKISLILPARNEARNLSILLPKVKELLPDAEIIVVNDGSTDDTEEVCTNNGIHVTSHPHGIGNGAAIKTGLRIAKNEIIVCMDADLQHRPEDIERLVTALEQGHDMVIGARSYDGQASAARGLANRIYNTLASWITGQKIKDLTSGFRAAKRDKFKSFIYLLPNGFSYPTTITMAFARAGYLISYVPITVNKRSGKSHIRLIHDGLRFLLIIFRVGTLYSPLKLFVPVSIVFFSTGILYYIYTYLSIGRLTNMSVLLFSTSVIIFLIGLVSEQITSLLYSNIQNDK